MAYQHGIDHYYNNIPEYYNLYYVKDVPTSKLSNYNSLLNFPQNFSFANNLVSIIGEDFCKKFVELMIEGAKIYHMGYEKLTYENYIKYQDLNDYQKRFFDWVKTYVYIRRYTEFLTDKDKYLHPILFYDRDEVSLSPPKIHPGTARMRCTEFLWKSQKRDILIDIVYYNSNKRMVKYLEEKLDIKWERIKTFDRYLEVYGYDSLESYNREDLFYKQNLEGNLMIQYDPEHRIGYPEYTHFLKNDQYVPYLYEAYYHLFDN